MEYLSSKKKSLRNVFLGLLFILMVAVLYGYFFLRSSIPPMDGQLKLKNLKAPVSVTRDQFGIPHIVAENDADLFRALGFVVASERLFQMEIERRMANGELAELFGNKLLNSDKLFRTLNLRQSMSSMLEEKRRTNTLDLKMWNEVEAFYDGVNQFQASGQLPIEFSLLGIKPRPFDVLDGYAFVGLMSFSFGVATSEDPLMTKLRARLGADYSNDLRNETTPFEAKENAKKTNNKRVVNQKNSFPVGQIIADLEQGFPLFEGSNGWLLSGKRSATGSPILANDPHITYSHPGVWYEAHIKSPGFESYGHFLSIIPFPVLSHNLERGWGLTMSLVDDMDIYREKIDLKTKTYQFKNQNIPYEEQFETIRVKGEKAYKMLVLKTQHGPILDQVFTEKEDKSLALKWAFHNPKNDPLLTLYKMGRAKNMGEFKAAVATGIAPGLNILYADKSNIAWWIFGEVAQKSLHESSDFILDGSSGLDEYTGFLTMDQKPHLENPKEGLIVSANARPVGSPNLPDTMRGDWQSDDRYKTLEAILSKKEKWSVEELKEVQTLSLNLENKLILEKMFNSLVFQNIWNRERSEEYLAILRKWDFVSDPTSIAPSLYYTWTREVTKILLTDLNSEEFETFVKLPNGWNFFKKVTLDDKSIWWKKFDRQKVFTDAFNNTIESLRQELGEDPNSWSWGHLHTIEFVHPIGRLKPFNHIFNLGPFAIAGASNEVNNQKSSAYKDGFIVKAGPSTRRIISFDHPEKAWGILPTGNSAHILSPFYKDQLKLFVKGDYREEWLLDSDIKFHQTHFLSLVPSSEGAE